MDVLRVSAAFVIFLSFVDVLSSTGTAQPPKYPHTLRLVHTLFRHGDRSPTSTYPKDPYNKDIEAGTLWPKGLGQLSTLGMKQHHKLGQYFRKRYDGFLPQIYNRKNIVIRSTDVDRTLMSAESHLSGLYPPVGVDIWNTTIPWQPIPVHTVPLEEDHLLTRDSVCPRYTKLYHELLNSPYVENIEKENKDFFAYLEKNSGIETIRINNTWKLYGILYIESLYNLTLPDWVKHDGVLQKLKVFDAMDFVLMANTTELKRLIGGGGTLVKELLTHWEMVANKTMEKDRKMIIYSAHDSTVASLLSALGMYNGLAPPYASCVIFELHELKPNQFSVQISFKNESDHEPYNLTFPGCEFSCPLEKIIKLTKPVVPENIIEECKIAAPRVNKEPIFSEAVIYGIIASIGFLLIFLQTLVICVVKRSRTAKYRQLSQTA